MRQRETPSLALRIYEIHHSYFQTNQTGSWFPESSFIQCCQERIQQSPLQYSEFFALRQLRVDLMTFQTIDYNLRTSRELDFRLIKASKNKLSEIHISRPTPQDSLSNYQNPSRFAFFRGFVFLKLTRISKFKYERKNEMYSRLSSKKTSWKWPIASLKLLRLTMNNLPHNRVQQALPKMKTNVSLFNIKKLLRMLYHIFAPGSNQRGSKLLSLEEMFMVVPQFSALWKLSAS